MRRRNDTTAMSLSRAKRRALYRRAKKTLHHALIQQWTGSRSSLEKHIRAFLRGKNRTYPLRLVRQHAFALAVATTLLAGPAANASPPIELSDISMNANSGGFVINGIDAGDVSGYTVSGAGDVNGDGLADLIIEAPGVYLGGFYVGESYVVFGKADGTAVELSSVVAGTGGFVINGADPISRSGSSVSGAGDVNGDGLDDLIVRAKHAEPDGESGAGESYVVFGKADGTAIELSDIALGTGGFVMNANDGPDRASLIVSGAGDVNGDGLADLIVGDPGASSGGFPGVGKSYVVFGKADGTAVELSAVAGGAGGFVINGFVFPPELSGWSVSGAGDVNGDGLADLIVGAPAASPEDFNTFRGRSYVVFGKADGTAVELTAVGAGAGGFVIEGIYDNEYSGSHVSGAGDVNGDGLADLIVASGHGDPFGLYESYVVFGKADGALVELSDIVLGSGGFIINGAGGDSSGAGDVNGDGLADLIVGLGGGGPSGTGASCVVFGKTDGTPVELSAVAAGTGGFVMNGIDLNDFAGRGVSGAGDVNGDGFADLIIGAEGGDPGGNSEAGESYVVFSPIPGPEQWVDFAFTGPPDGTQTSPFQQFQHALNAVSSGGTINIKGNTAVSSTSGSFTLDKPMTIKAVNGTVTLGAP